MIDPRPRRWVPWSRRPEVDRGAVVGPRLTHFAIDLLSGTRARAHDGGLFIVLCVVAAYHLGGSL